jgi:hypothetical protein
MISMRSFGMLCAATLGAVLVPSAGVAAPGEAARPRVVVVNAVDLPDSLSDIRAQLRTTLNDAVTKHGFDLAPEAGACGDRECLRVAAKSANASDVLVATGGRNDMRGYHIALRIWNVASDREDNAIAECNICAAAQMVESVASAADPLLDRVPTLHANLSAAAPQAAAEPAPTPAPLITAPAPPAEAKRSRRWIGWTLIGAGIAGGAVSGYLFAIDGKDTECSGMAKDKPCIYSWDTIIPASIVAGASAAAIIGGLIYLRHASESGGDVTVSLQPFGVAIRGRL